MANKKNSLQTGTPTWLRVSIWGILILTIVSTVALYASSFLQTKTQQEDQKKQSQLLKSMKKLQVHLMLQA